MLLQKPHPTGIPSRRDTSSHAPPSVNREEVQKKQNFVGVIAFYFCLLWSHTYTRAALGVCQNSSCIHSHFVSLLLKPARGAWHIRGVVCRNCSCIQQGGAWQIREGSVKIAPGFSHTDYTSISFLRILLHTHTTFRRALSTHVRICMSMMKARMRCNRS